MNASTPTTVLDCLSADMRRDLEALGRTGRGLFGRLRTQQIVKDNLDLIRRLRALPATHADLAALFAAVGITAKTGEPLTAGAISSAISREEAKTLKRRPHRKHADWSGTSAVPARKSSPVTDKAPALPRGGTPVHTIEPQLAGFRAAEDATAGAEANSLSRRDPEPDRDDARAAVFALLNKSMDE